MDAESIRSEVAFRFSPVERPRRPARAEELDPRRGALRRRGLAGADRRRARRVLERLGPVVRAVAQDERSQLRNRELATDRIVEQLREATHVRRPRRATKPTARRASGGSRGSAGSGRRSACAARRRTEQAPIRRRQRSGVARSSCGTRRRPPRTEGGRMAAPGGVQHA